MLIGIVIGAHGIKGTCKIRSFAESLSLFTPGMELLAPSKSGGPDQQLEIDWVKPHTRIVLASFREISDRTQAEALIGSELYIPKEMLPDLDEDTHYWSDLIGMDVFTIDREYLGRLESIIETGSNDVYVVKHDQKEVLIPALGSVVVDIDVDHNRMEVDLPEGLV